MAFCRMLIEERIGLLPLSGICIDNEEQFDSFIRVSCNRSFNDLDLFRDALIKLKKAGIIL